MKFYLWRCWRSRLTSTRERRQHAANGESLGVGRDALCVLYLALSGYHHTVLHAYANWAAIPHHDDPYIRRGANWTLSTNAVALPGRVCQHDPRSMERAWYNGSGHGPSWLWCSYMRLQSILVMRALSCARAGFIQTLVAYELG